MRFPLIDMLGLPCAFERIVPGQLHPDGRRYLPLLILRPIVAPAAETVSPADLRIGVVDRHHRVDPAATGRDGLARLVFALSTLRLQSPPYRLGFVPELGAAVERASLAPTLLGRVAAVVAWERGSAQLSQQSIYAELVIDAGVGMVGLRTNLAVEDLSAQGGSERLAPGDWVELQRSRIDILGFEPSAPTPLLQAGAG